MPGLELDDVIAPKRDAAALKRRRGAPLELDDMITPQAAGPAEAAPTTAPEPAEPEDELGDDALNLLLGAEDGLTLGNTHNLGRIGAGIATRVSDLFSPSLERDGMAPEYAGSRGAGDWLSELTDAAQETTAGKLGRAVGTGVTALGLGGVAGPSVGAQAMTGAGLGGAAAAGESDFDPLAILEGTAAGGALGATGGAFARGMGVRPTMPQLGRSAAVGGVLGGVTSPHDPLGGAARGAAYGAGGRMVRGALPQSVGGAVRGMSQLGAAGAGTAAGALAQPDVAYGTAPTMAWGVQSVLSSGSSGLAPADEQRLTEAVLSGDMDKLISANFALQQRNPAYAARLQRELEALQEEDE